MFIGEAEATWPQFLAEWQERRHASRYEQAERTDMSQVPVPRYPFPVLLDRIHYLDLAIDHDPYLFWGAVSGCLTRLSSSALLNVTAGAGSVVPTYIVES